MNASNLSGSKPTVLFNTLPKVHRAFPHLHRAMPPVSCSFYVVASMASGMLLRGFCFCFIMFHSGVNKLFSRIYCELVVYCLSQTLVVDVVDSRAGAIPTPNYGESFLCSNLKANKSILAQELILLKRIMIHNLKVLGFDPALADSGDAEFVLRNAGAISLSGMVTLARARTAFLRLFQGNR